MTGFADIPGWRPELPILTKPFTPDALAARVRAALDGASEPARA